MAGPKPEDPYLSPPGSVPPATGPGRARPTQTHMHDVPACVAQTSGDCAVRHMQVHYEEKATMKSLVIVRLERSDDLEAGSHDDRQRRADSQQR